MSIILPPRSRKLPDPYIEPVHGSHGPCALCQQYSKLTENHVPPGAVGNTDRWAAHSYMTTMTANRDLIFGRRFNGGVRFRTLCARCNNGLGAREDKALIDFYDRTRKLVESPLQLPPVMRIPARPNLIIRDLLAHIVSANDTGIPSAFDDEARRIFFGKKSLRLSSWNVFYWVFVARELFVARSLFLASWYPTLELHEVQVLKVYPLAFAFTDSPTFHGLPNMMRFVQPRDDEETEVPLFLNRRDDNPIWPAYASPNRIIFMGGNSYGIVARQD